MVTWLLASGRSQGIVPSCRKSVIRLMIRCAKAIGSGMSSGVSLQAKPNIIPWSPAPISLPCATVLIHAQGDIRRLLAEGDHDRARRGVETHVAGGIADLAHDLANDRRIVDHGLGRDLSGQADQSSGEQALAGDPSVRILREDRVQYAVGNLVGHLVGMAHRDGFACEQVVVFLRHGNKVSNRSTIR